ncbi:DUF6913 domain-containing protein [Oceanihabitans sediminis]|uniref:DUF6913 domain-containing protein n=1 Tax=Oceanihabitans sediminis TaxID=1812012 RepID=UPI00299CD77D|nr:hypothetical protein [Oceanihabitans sediminis]MDX1774799.1 hypothetical protein [Oceanihabitans sediminis]
MILKGFKQNSTKKSLEAMLHARQVLLNDDKIKSLGVVLHIDEMNDFKAFEKLAEALHVKPNNLKIISFTSNNKNKKNAVAEAFFSAKDFGWKGKVKNEELQAFINQPFDALISFYQEDILELKYITAASQAKFKIGILQSDNRINDLIIKTELKDVELFQSETIKYLNIFNKINNE